MRSCGFRKAIQMKLWEGVVRPGDAVIFIRIRVFDGIFEYVAS